MHDRKLLVPCVALLALLSLVMGGCLLPLAVNPFHTGPDDAIHDESLLGHWAVRKHEPSQHEADEGAAAPASDHGHRFIMQFASQWRFEPGQQPRRYRAILTDDQDRSARFDAVLLRIGDRRFLDLFPEQGEQDMPLASAMHMPPMHSLIRFNRPNRDTFAIAFIDMDAVAQLLKEQPQLIDHAWVRSGEWSRQADDADSDAMHLIFTAESAALQRFVTEHLDDETYLGEWYVYQRVADPEPEANAESNADVQP